MLEGEVTPDAAYWIKEVQRRSYELEKAVRDGAPEDELASLHAAIAEAVKHREAAEPSPAPRRP